MLSSLKLFLKNDLIHFLCSLYRAENVENKTNEFVKTISDKWRLGTCNDGIVILVSIEDNQVRNGLM